MIQKIKYKDFIWLNIKEPTKKDIDYLAENFHFHPLILEELRKPSLRSHIDHWQDYLYFVYHIPEFERKISSSQPKEIDFLLTKTHLITVHYERVKILEAVIKKIKADEKEMKFYFEDGPGFLLYKILKESTSYSLRQLAHIKEKISLVEKEIFDKKASIKKQEQLVQSISLIKRDILNFQLTSHPHQKLLESLFLEGNKFFGRRFKIYFSSLAQEHLRVEDNLENYQKVLESLETTCNNLVNLRINEVMKIFTILAFITFPLMLFTSMFGMNTAHTPILGCQYDFWLIIFIMTSLTVLMYFYFKSKRWM